MDENVSKLLAMIIRTGRIGELVTSLAASDDRPYTGFDIELKPAYFVHRNKNHSNLFELLSGSEDNIKACLNIEQQYYWLPEVASKKLVGAKQVNGMIFPSFYFLTWPSMLAKSSANFGEICLCNEKLLMCGKFNTVSKYIMNQDRLNLELVVEV